MHVDVKQASKESWRQQGFIETTTSVRSTRVLRPRFGKTALGAWNIRVSNALFIPILDLAFRLSFESRLIVVPPVIAQSDTEQEDENALDVESLDFEALVQEHTEEEFLDEEDGGVPTDDLSGGTEATEIAKEGTGPNGDDDGAGTHSDHIDTDTSELPNDGTVLDKRMSDGPVGRIEGDRS